MELSPSMPSWRWLRRGSACRWCRGRAPLLSAYPVRALRLGRNAPTRQIALVCRGVERGDRRIAAVRAALSEAFAQAASNRHIERP